MDSERLREIIARATIPLIAENETLTIARIARAAGVEEADVLSVFENPSAVLRASTDTVKAAVDAALDPTVVLGELHAISLQRPLAARLADAIRALDSYRNRVATLLAPLNSPAPGHDEIDTSSVSTGASRTEVIRQGVARLLEPDQARLRSPAGLLAAAFLGMYAACRAASDQDPEQVVDLFLHGASVSESSP